MSSAKRKVEFNTETDRKRKQVIISMAALRVSCSSWGSRRWQSVFLPVQNSVTNYFRHRDNVHLITSASGRKACARSSYSTILIMTRKAVLCSQYLHDFAHGIGVSVDKWGIHVENKGLLLKGKIVILQITFNLKRWTLTLKQMAIKHITIENADINTRRITLILEKKKHLYWKARDWHC